MNSEHTMICPEHLSEFARAEWDRMISVEQITPADEPALAAYCAAYGRWKDAEVNIQKHGTILKNKAGNAVANPYISVAETSMGIMHKFLQLLHGKQADGKAVF
jgi:P27 family predicted phage terminase small subunit